MKRAQQLLSPASLAALMAQQHVRLFEVGCDAIDQFHSGHIDGATYIDTNAIEHGPLWNKVADEALLAVLGMHGLHHDSCVVLYGRNNLAAARLAHLMLYAGVADVRLLDGGFASWCAANGALRCGPGRKQASSKSADACFGGPFPAHPEYVMSMAQTRSFLRQAAGALVSIRSRAEFEGQTSGYSYIPGKGEIAGALWGRAGADHDVNSMSAYHDVNGCMKAAGEISRFWLEAGIEPGRPAAFYCGTGWRASLAFFYAWLMGWPQISVYDGGWLEWSSDPLNQGDCIIHPGRQAGLAMIETR